VPTDSTEKKDSQPLRYVGLRLLKHPEGLCGSGSSPVGIVEEGEPPSNPERESLRRGTVRLKPQFRGVHAPGQDRVQDGHEVRGAEPVQRQLFFRLGDN